MGHPRKLLLFVALSLADLGLTCWLLSASGGSVYEANPLARWCLTRLGWIGLAGHKAVAVLVVLGIVAALGRSRPAAAGRLLGVGCVVTGLVVAYSATLVRAALASPEASALRELSRMDESNQRSRALTLRRLAFFGRLADDVRERRGTLKDAAARVIGSEWFRKPVWWDILAIRYPGRSQEELGAVVAMKHALKSLSDHPQECWQLSVRLREEYRLTFGRDWPLTPEEYLPAESAAE